MTSQIQKERGQTKTIPGGTTKKRIALQSLWMTSKRQKERAQKKTILGGTKKKRELLRPSGDLIRIGSKIAIQTINMFLSRTLSLLNYQHKLLQLLTSTIRKHTWTIRNTMDLQKRKSAKSYPRRREEKREFLKASRGFEEPRFCFAPLGITLCALSSWLFDVI